MVLELVQLLARLAQGLLELEERGVLLLKVFLLLVHQVVLVLVVILLPIPVLLALLVVIAV